MLSLNIPSWKLFEWFRRLQLWATGDWQLHHDNSYTMFIQSFLAKHHITQVTQVLGDMTQVTSYHPGPYNQYLVPCDIWLFPNLKLPLKGKKFQTVDATQEKRTGKLMAIGRIVWGPKVPTLKGTKASLSYVECSLYLVKSSKNVSIFILHGWILYDRPRYCFAS